MRRWSSNRFIKLQETFGQSNNYKKHDRERQPNKNFAKKSGRHFTFDSVFSRERDGLSGSAQFLDSVSFRFRPEAPELVLSKCRLPLLGHELACRWWVGSLRSDWSTPLSESESFTLRGRPAVLARLAAIISRGCGSPVLVSESLPVTSV